MGPGVFVCFFFSANLDFADILGDTDFDFEISFGIFLDPKFLDSQIPKLLDCQHSNLAGGCSGGSSS